MAADTRAEIVALGHRTYRTHYSSRFGDILEAGVVTHVFLQEGGRAWLPLHTTVSDNS